MNVVYPPSVLGAAMRGIDRELERALPRLTPEERERLAEHTLHGLRRLAPGTPLQRSQQLAYHVLDQAKDALAEREWHTLRALLLIRLHADDRVPDYAEDVAS